MTRQELLNAQSLLTVGRDFGGITIGNRVPQDYFETKGVGESDITIHAGSYHLALKEAGIESYEELVQKTSEAVAEYSVISEQSKAIEKRMKEISTIQKYIAQYGKTREIFQRYKASEWDNSFYEEHRAEITLHRAAKKFFDSLGLKKFPKIDELKREYAELKEKKRKLYSGYPELKERRTHLLTAKANVQKILGIKNDGIERDSLTKPTR